MNIHRSPVLLASTIALLTFSTHSLAWTVTAHICLDDDNGTAEGYVRSHVALNNEDHIIQFRSELKIRKGTTGAVQAQKTEVCTRLFSGGNAQPLPCRASAEHHGLLVGQQYCSTGTGTAIFAGGSAPKTPAPSCETWQGGGGH